MTLFPGFDESPRRSSGDDDFRSVSGPPLRFGRRGFGEPSLPRRYFDHAAAAPLLPEAHEAMSEAAERFGNPSSVHADGRAARATIERARRRVADLCGTTPESVVFTGNGTEACNLGVQPTAVRRRAVLSAVEHAAVVESVRRRHDVVREAPVSADGSLELDALRDLLAEDSGETLLCVMPANNETGILQPMEPIADMARTYGAFLFCDAVQAAGKISVRMDDLGCDAAAVSSFKIGGPPGVGALVLRAARDLSPLVVGGGQERGLRAGTENVIGIAGFGAAARVAAQSAPAFAAVADLRDLLEADLIEGNPDMRIVGRSAPRLPNVSCFGLPGTRADILVMALDLAGMSVGAGAACADGTVTPGRVLPAMGETASMNAAALRASLGRETTRADVRALSAAYLRLSAGRAPARATA